MTKQLEANLQSDMDAQARVIRARRSWWRRRQLIKNKPRGDSGSRVMAMLLAISLGGLLVGQMSARSETTTKSSTAPAIGPLYFGGTNLYCTPDKSHEWINKEVTSYQVHSSADQYFSLNLKTHQLIIQPSNAPVRTINLTEAEANAMRDAILAAANQRK